MHSISTRLKFQTPYLFDVMPECNHSFLGCMRRGKMGTYNNCTDDDDFEIGNKIFEFKKIHGLT
jgi:hypothetical protein